MTHTTSAAASRSDHRITAKPVRAAFRAVGMMTILWGVVALTGCSRMAVWMAPDKAAAESSTPLARDATAGMQTALFAHRYEDLPVVTEMLTRAYVANPRDPQVTLHLALAHLWAVSERGRLEQPPARITDSLILAEKYFSEAQRLSPEDDRIKGWLASTRAALAQVHQDPKLQRSAYFALKESARAYPEFNEFVVGFVLSNLPPKDPRYAEAVEAFWRNLDVCIGQKVDRANPDLRPYLAMATQSGPKRVCWNTAKVPHNLEGFMLAMGDALVKNGQPDLALTLFQNVRALPSYASWKYRDVLEQRISTAKEWSAIFANETDVTKHPQQLRGSAISCTVCHGA